MFWRCERCTDTSITKPSLVGVGLSSPLGGAKSSMCFGNSITFLYDKVCERNFAMKAETILVSFDRGMFIDIQPRSTLSLQLCNAGRSHDILTNLKKVKFGIFCPQMRQIETIEIKFGI